MSSNAASDIRFEIGHVLFIDIVGYSNLLITQQSEQLDTLRTIVRGAAQFRAAEAEGKLLRLPTGDGGALVFRTTPEAPVLCALEIGKELKKHPELRLRMGIHSGPVNAITDLNEQANVAGAGINIAQRVMDCGDAGHILLSKRVAEDLEHYPRWQPYLHDLGECEVKHGGRVSVVNFYTDDVGNSALPEKLKTARTPVAEPRPTRAKRVVTVALGIAALGAIGILAWLIMAGGLRSREDTNHKPIETLPSKSIAVLPFADLSQAHDQEYFCDGISEEILGALAKVDGLRVVARTSSFSFKEKNADVREIARKLDVQNILEGSLRREGNRIRITAQLVNATDASHIWSETYERELQGVFAVQDEITHAIVDALKIKLAVEPPARSQQNTEAYDLYLKGLYLSNKSDEENLRKSLTLFQRALDIDPNFARAWTGIAKAWYWLADAYVRPDEAYPIVKEAALKALALDSRDAEALSYLGDTKWILDRDPVGGEAEFQRALEIDSNSAPAHLFMALLKSAEGEFEEAIKHIKDAERLDPLAPVISSFAVVVYLAADRIDDAIEAGKRTFEVDPDFVYFDPALADAYREKGEFDKAIVVYDKAQAKRNFPSAGLAITYAKMGRTEDAQHVLDQLLEKSRQQYVAADSIAAVYAAIGDKDEAFRWLERAVDEHSAPMLGFIFNPDFRALQSDPRFADLVRRIGLDPAKVLSRQGNR